MKTNIDQESENTPDLMPEDLAYLKNFFIDVLHTGSRVICDPPVLDTDDDWVVLCKDKEQQDSFEKLLEQSGYQEGGSRGETGDFRSWKREIVLGVEHEDNGQGTTFSYEETEILNLIVTSSREFLDRWTKATWLAKKLNLREKDHRILLFRAISDGLFTELPKKIGKKSFKWYASKTFHYVDEAGPVAVNPGAVNNDENIHQPDHIGRRLWQDGAVDAPNANPVWVAN